MYVFPHTHMYKLHKLLIFLWSQNIRFRLVIYFFKQHRKIHISIYGKEKDTKKTIFDELFA